MRQKSSFFYSIQVHWNQIKATFGYPKIISSQAVLFRGGQPPRELKVGSVNALGQRRHSGQKNAKMLTERGKMAYRIGAPRLIEFP